MRKVVLWVEREPDTARYAEGAMHMLWLQFWLGFRTMWPNPKNAKRVRIAVSVRDDPCIPDNPVVIAHAMEDMLLTERV